MARSFENFEDNYLEGIVDIIYITERLLPESPRVVMAKKQNKNYDLKKSCPSQYLKHSKSGGRQAGVTKSKLLICQAYHWIDSLMARDYLLLVGKFIGCCFNFPTIYKGPGEL